MNSSNSNNNWFSSEQVLKSFGFEKVKWLISDYLNSEERDLCVVLLYNKDDQDRPYISKVDDLWFDTRQDAQNFLGWKSLFVWPDDISVSHINRMLIDR